MSLQKKILNFDLITRLPSPPYHLFPLSVSRRDGTARRRSRRLCPRAPDSPPRREESPRLRPAQDPWNRAKPRDRNSG